MSTKETLKRINPSSLNVWEELMTEADRFRNVLMRDLFEQDADRVARFSLQVGDIYLDYSKNRIDPEVLDKLLQLASETDLKDGVRKMVSGAQINETEGRAAYHVALRAPRSADMIVDGENIMHLVHAVLNQMQSFVERLDESWKGFTGKRITDVVNIGIGGSDLGPVMVAEALRPYHVKNRKVHFVSNVDGSHIAQTLAELNQETTLFIIASKTFTTIETMTNAHSARKWFLEEGEVEDIRKHFVAVSTNIDAVEEFGIDAQNAFEFWDWVGGRYSLSSAIGLSVMVAVGSANFREMLNGMHAMDQHFQHEELENNMPVILALLGIWYSNFMGAQSEAMLPYDQNLQFLSSYFQQASMESNGKMVDRSGKRVTYDTGAILWGGAGTNSQHSFFQLLHQGTHLIPCDFILAANPSHRLFKHHDLLVANALAQCEALMNGKSEEEVRKELIISDTPEEQIEEILPFKVFDGNRPTNMIMMKKLTPFNLGALIALYEHKIFVQGYIWNIFSFDQFGVELGKQLAKALQPEITGESKPEKHDASTNTLLNKFKAWREY
ncbi:MAG: glucose-6-phosphate isomerase [Saprospiraceae bacterium]|nr:glucose-6-phosphate isomerase [Saprospiraceae bacterium]